jgi:hypothetical protein
MLEIETRDCCTSSKTSETLKSRRKRVTFRPYASQIKLPPSESDGPQSMWYSKEQMLQLARADAESVMAQSKSGTFSDKNVCGRGLEMYLPGELKIRQQRRISYTRAVLQKQETLKTLSGNNKDEVAEGLRKFSELKSKQCRAEAQALAVQDALDVAKDANTKTTSDHHVEGSIRAMQMMTLRNACMMRTT